MRRRVVITSIGIISSLGSNEKKIIENIENFNTNFKISSFDNDQLYCPINNFNVKEYIGRFKDSRYLTRSFQFILAAISKVINESNLKQAAIENAGLFLGVGPNLDIEGEFPEIKNNSINWDKKAALWILRFLPNTAASIIAKLYNIHGENLTISTACTSSLQAIGEAFRKIKYGELNCAFAGGGDSRLSIGGLQAYKKAGALFQKANKNIYAPFSKNRSGFVPGEGGAVFLLEEFEFAKKRNANIIAEINGYGISIDGYSLTAPLVSGKWAEQAIKSAVKEAAIELKDINVIAAHATGTLLNDEMESFLLNRNFKKNQLVTSIKSWIGHLSAACGAAELAIMLFCMKHNLIPEIRNLNDPCSEEINFALKNIKQKYNTLLIENFGFGGQNCAMIIMKFKK